MNATLLCPGPSLERYDPMDRSGWVVGVNRAATVHACDVWAATDWPLVLKYRPMGQPALLTIKASREALERKGEAWPHLVITHCGMAGEVVTNAKHPWTSFSATAALYYLGWMGVERIDVYGADMAGELDWDGVKGGTGRNDNRWARERVIWDDLVASMDAEVVRHT